MTAVRDRAPEVSVATESRRSEPTASALAEEIIGRLVGQRQELRRSGGSSTALEANRLAIVYWQRRLASAHLAEQREA
jgi:hypothetical protein